MSSDLRNIALKDIRENQVALRTVDKEDSQYISLRDSVGKIGVTKSIEVREKSEEVDGVKVTYFELIDGLHRFSAACDNQLATIPAMVVTASEAEVLERQIVGNLVHIDTKPAQYADQLKRMFNLNPTLTKAEVAARLSQSPKWIDDRSSLTKLDVEVQKLVDAGDIKLSNAYALAKLPKDEQPAFIEQAMTQETGEFATGVNARAKELRDAARQGRDPAQSEAFVPTPSLRKPSEVKDEREHKKLGAALVAQVGAKSAVEGFYAAIDFVLQMDPDTLTAKKAKFEANVAKRKADKEAGEKQRAEAKAAAAAAKVAALNAKAAA